VKKIYPKKTPEAHFKRQRSGSNSTNERQKYNNTAADEKKTHQLIWWNIPLFTRSYTSNRWLFGISEPSTVGTKTPSCPNVLLSCGETKATALHCLPSPLRSLQ